MALASITSHIIVCFVLLGRTLSVRVMKDERGRSRGFGFVNYANHEDAQKVVCAKVPSAQNGYLPTVTICYIDVKAESAALTYHFVVKLVLFNCASDIVLIIIYN